MVEESMWGFRVLICKTESLIWGCEKEEREIFIVFMGSMNGTIRKRRRKEISNTQNIIKTFFEYNKTLI